MLVLVVYDIQTVSPEGKHRLRQVAKVCEAVGRRVQNSVFECLLDASQLRSFQDRLGKLIDRKTDSVRYYNLGNTYDSRVIATRKEKLYSLETPLIL